MKYLPNHKKIMLIITERCNLECVYCYEKNKNERAMSFDTARKILDDAYASMDGYESMVIVLHGGEPFLNFELIKKIDQYVVEHYPSIPVLFQTITNGTMVHGKIQEWLRERKDRHEIMLSLDGKQRQHDENRKTLHGKGSFGQIDIAFFRKTWANCPVSMTINERNISHLAEGTIWLQELGFRCCNAFEWAANWNVEQSKITLQQELDKLVQYYTAHPEQELCLLLKYHLQDFYNVVDEPYHYCVAIDEPLECYDARGRYAPCHGFTEFTMRDGEKAAEFANYSIHDFTIQDANLCNKCRLIHLCRICPAANYMLTGDMQKQSLEICLFNRMCIQAGIQIQKIRISHKMLQDIYDKEVLQVADDVEDYLSKWV